MSQEFGGFDGKVVLVTGAGSGIGEAISVELAARGAKVVVSDVSADAAARTVAAIVEKGGVASSFTADVSQADQVRASVDFAVETYGGLHLAVNNAGIAAKNAVPTGELDLQTDWERVIGVNLNGVLYGLRYQIPAIIAAGGGAIVNIASIHGYVAALNNSAYVAAKHAVVGLTKNAGAEYAAKGVRINAVAPGYILTPLLEASPAEFIKSMEAKNPIGRLGTSQEIANLTAFLLSEQASFTTGSTYVADGGYTAI